MARHDVTPEDVEEVVQHRPHYFANLPGKTATHVMVGQNWRGRYLLAAMSQVNNQREWYVVTAAWLERRRGARLYNRN